MSSGFRARLLIAIAAVAVFPLHAQVDPELPIVDVRGVRADPALMRTELLLMLRDALAEDVRREWSVKCDAAIFEIYDSDDDHDISISLSNKGACPFTLRFFDDDGKVEAIGPIPANTPRTINREDIKKITVDCDGAAANDCKASYTLRESD